MTLYRWKEGKRRGRWLPTLEEAREAAVMARAALYDDDRKQIFLNPLTVIEERR